jgi:hypothetical protein
MVATTYTYLLEGAGNTKLAITREGLRSLLGQIETELYRSEAYQDALANLQKSLDDQTGVACRALVKSVGREAIRLALRQLIRQYRATDGQDNSQPQSHQSNSPLIRQELSPANASATSSVPTHPSASTTVQFTYPEVEQPVRSSSDRPGLSSRLDESAGESRAIVQVHATTQSALVVQSSSTPQQQQDRLRQIGRELHQARVAQSISLDELNRLTWVPVHQIKALETGDIARLPEAIYVRGFIRRIADTLKLDGESMVASLVALEQQNEVLPSCQLAPLASPSYIQPVHLYLGYAALLAGAVGGLTWMSQQPGPGQALNLGLPKFVSPTETQPVEGQTTQDSIQKTRVQHTTPFPQIVPPEWLHL